MIIAIFILSFVVMSIMMVMIVSTRNTMALKDEENALQFGLEVLEDCEQVPFDIGATSADYAEAIADKSKNRNSDSGNTMRATTTATMSGTEDSSGLPISAEVTVDVTWNTALGGNKTIQLNREVSVSGWQNVGDRSK
jgi:hypothetical protein